MSTLDCTFCDHANPSGAKFCNECGAPLHLTLCRHCSAVNDATDTQCYRCGAPTGSASAGADPVGPPLEEAETLLRDIEHELEALEERAAPAAAPRREPVAQAAWESVVQARQASAENRRESLEAWREPAEAEERLEPLEARREPAEEERRETLEARRQPAEERRKSAEDRRKSAAEPAAPVVRLADIPLRAAQPHGAVLGDFQMREVASLVNARLEEPSRRWRRNMATAAVAMIALTLPAGGYLYQLFQPAPESTVSVPVDVSTDRRTDAPPAPIAALLQGTGDPTESRVDAAVSEPPPAPPPAPEAAPEAPCPAAVKAIALCDWAARAERR